MNEGAHLLLAIALVALLLHPDDATPYLVGIVGVFVPSIDYWVVLRLLRWGVLDGPLWEDRALLHSLLVGAAIVGVGYRFGYWRPAAIGFAAAVVPDVFYGGVKLFLPVSFAVVGVDAGAPWTTQLIAVTSGTVIGVEALRQVLAARSRSRAESDRSPRS